MPRFKIILYQYVTLLLVCLLSIFWNNIPKTRQFMNRWTNLSRQIPTIFRIDPNELFQRNEMRHTSSD
jgi:hypothetical protein